MKEGSTRILLVDDHTILRHALGAALAKLPGVRAVDEAGSCLAALDQMAARPPDLVILDVHLSEMDGIEGARRILAQHPEVKIIMLSGDSNPNTIMESLRAGAHAYLIKENSPEEMARAIQAVMSGHGYFSPEVAAAIARYCREHPLGPESATPLLSDRDKHLLALIAQGKRNKEIAVQLNVAIKSVEAYRARLKVKLGCNSSAELISYAIREGIVPS